MPAAAPAALQYVFSAANDAMPKQRESYQKRKKRRKFHQSINARKVKQSGSVYSAASTTSSLTESALAHDDGVNVSTSDLLAQNDMQLEDCLAELENQQLPEKTDANTGLPRPHETEDNKMAGGKTSPVLGPWFCEMDRSKAKTRARKRLPPDLEQRWRRNDFSQLPSIDIEIQRHFLVAELTQFLLDHGVKMPQAERWLIDGKLETDHLQVGAGLSPSTTLPSYSTTSDPVLSKITLQSPASQRLITELSDGESSSVSRQEATKVVAIACRKIQSAIVTLSKAPRTPSLRHGDRIVLESTVFSSTAVADTPSTTSDGTSPVQEGQESTTPAHSPAVQMYTIVYHRKRWKKPFTAKINRSHYEKLKNMFVVEGDFTSSGRATPTQHAFNCIVLILLIRYSALAGGQLLKDMRGGGMQGAINEEVFRCLASYNESVTECFASPFNCTCVDFCSAFEDLDCYFGSQGNFFTAAVTKSFENSILEANPPFTPGMVDKLVDHMELLMSKSVCLTIVVIIPTASREGAVAKRLAFPSFQRLVKNQFCRENLIFRAREHGYVEGSQHMRPTRYKTSPFDTSVIIWSTADTLPNGMIKSLQSAFASRSFS